MTTRLAVIAALLLVGTAANAQAPKPRAAAPAVAPPPAKPAVPPKPDVADPARLQAFMATPYYKSLVKQGIDGMPRDMFERCPGLVSNGSQVTVLKPVRYSDTGFPVDGIWKMAFPVSGCGPDVTLNFFFVAKVDQTIDTYIGFPGSTRVDPVLQHNALTSATTGATTALQDQGAAACPSYAVKNTKFEAFGLENPPTPDPGPAETRRPWWESWTVSGCGRTFLVPLDFIPRPGLVEIVQPGHVTQLALYGSGPIAPNPYARDPDPAPAPAPTAEPPAAKP